MIEPDDTTPSYLRDPDEDDTDYRTRGRTSVDELLHPGVGKSVPGWPEVIDVRGYDPVSHNLFGFDVLHQDREWIDRDGIRWRLEDMTVSHRRNLLGWLRRRAAALEFRDALLLLGGPFAPRGDMASMACDDFLDERADHPGAWLETLPLVKRLAELVSADVMRPAPERASYFERDGEPW